jgi:predicted DNA-binding protein
MVALNEAYAKLASLSEERARRVVELISDLAALEAVEQKEDIAAAEAVLTRIKEGEETYSLEELKREIS